MSPGPALAFSLLLLLGNAFFVGAEFAVMAARRSQLEPLADAGSRRAQMCLQALEQVASLLACAQLGITVCSVLLGALAEDALHHLLAPLLAAIGLPDALGHAVALAIALLVVAYLHVVLGEMVPKNLAIAGPERSALLLGPPLLLVTRALRPLIRVMEWVAKSIVRAMGVEPKDEIASAFTAEEVREIVSESAREGLLEEEARGLTTRVLEFSDRVADDVAVGVDDLVVLDVGFTPADVERLVARHGFSRFPVRAASGELEGYLHLKDVLYADDVEHEEPVPRKRIRRLATVARSDEVEDVLATMQRSGAHLARVVERTGKVIGVVFLEDVLEELVGEVTDAAQRAGATAARRREGQTFGEGGATHDNGGPTKT
ncbi:hemolysin family protein [Agilicoccus flavus]|uniref:hemolysin family protein n=1 Tax=Agilicoccus flavus TaxID=2775968 RepID=UPI001CF69B36|nr:hemolysin family protein [Agilicoccus flavus]